MLPKQHTFFSDPHISDPMRWIEGEDDPMLLAEAAVFGARKKTRERIQLVFGTFILVLILVFTTSVADNPNFTRSQAAISEPVQEDLPKNPLIHTFPPELSAQAYSIRFLGIPVPLVHQREWKQLPPASITKLLTAVVARENLAQNAIITISPNAKKTGDKMSKIATGDRMHRNDALKVMLIESANDVAAAIAEEIEKIKTENNPQEGGQEFLRIMNETAARIGMQNSRFFNPTGLDHEGHLTTAEDFSRLMEYVALMHPELWEITKLPTAEVISVENRLYKLENTNELLREFPALGGGKTGFTDEARGTLVLLYPVLPSYTALIVIFGSEDRFEDGRKLIRWLEEEF